MSDEEYIAENLRTLRANQRFYRGRLECPKCKDYAGKCPVCGSKRPRPAVIARLERMKRRKNKPRR